MNLSISRRAKADIASIRRSIEAENPKAAKRLMEQFWQRWRLLQDFPFSGASREDLGEGARHVVVGSYLALYRVGDDEIEIVRVLHGSRKIGTSGAAASS